MFRLVKVFAIALLIGLITLGCSTEAEKVEGEKTPLKIGVLRIDDSLPFFIAQEEKLFAKYNVDVEVVPFGSARDKDIALEAGELSGVMTDLIVTGLIKKGGTDVKVVSYALGANSQEGRFAIVTSSKSEINSVEDLKDVPIAISNNTIIHYLAENMVKEMGLAEEEIKTQSIPDLKVRLEALLEGKDVKAALLPDPLAAFAEKMGAKAVIDDTKLDKNLSQSVVIFREDVIEHNKDAIEGVMKAYNEAINMLNANPEKYRQLIFENITIPEPLKEEYQVPTFTPNAVPDKEMVKRIMDWMVEKELLEKSYSYEEIVNDSFIK